MSHDTFLDYQYSYFPPKLTTMYFHIDLFRIGLIRLLGSLNSNPNQIIPTITY